MTLRQRFSDAYNAFRRGGKTNTVSQEKTGQICVNPLCSSYENVFGQVRVVIDELTSVRPYGVTERGKRLPLSQTPELAQLDCPNEEMGWSDFADAMFATWLTEEELNIHVWKTERGRIAGYSILPIGCRRTDLGTGEDYFEVYTINGSERLSRGEVMTLRYSRSPRNLDKGVSPATAGENFAQLQDVLIQYQKAWVENGATPASITTIIAKNRNEFEKKKKDLESNLHGAKNKGKTIFLYRQMLPNGETADEVSVKTIQPPNSTLGVKDLNNLTVAQMDRLFGVSPFLMGDDSSAKYDNAELSDLLFTKRRIIPALRSFWAQFQHELDRIFNGLGYAIEFDKEIPELTDRLKVKAETAGKTIENLTALINAGALPDSVLDALELDDKWLAVVKDIYREKSRATTAVTEVSGATIVKQTPDKLPTSHNCNCSTDCIANCSHHHTIDAPNGSYNPDFTADEVRERKIYDQLQKLLENAISEALGEGVVLSDTDVAKIRQAIQDELLARADEGADDAAKSIEGFVLGATAEEIEGVLKNRGFHMTDDFTKRLEERTETLVNRFREHAKEVVAATLNPLREQGLGAGEIKKALQAVMPRARAATIARNETVYAFRAGTLENARYLGDKYALRLKKIWRCHHDSRTCPICEAMDGQTVELDSAFPDGADGADGIRYSFEQNSWNDDGQIPSAHVNCRCWFELEVVNG